MNITFALESIGNSFMYQYLGNNPKSVANVQYAVMHINTLQFVLDLPFIPGSCAVAACYKLLEISQASS